MDKSRKEEKECLRVIDKNSVLEDKCPIGDDDPEHSTIQSYHVRHYSTKHFLKFDNQAGHPVRCIPLQEDTFVMSLLAFPFVTIHCVSGSHSGEYLLMDSNGDICFGSNQPAAIFQYSPSLLGRDTFFLAKALMFEEQNQVRFVSFNNDGLPLRGITLLDNDCILELAPTNILSGGYKPLEPGERQQLNINRRIQDAIQKIKAGWLPQESPVTPRQHEELKAKEEECKEPKDRQVL